MYLLTGRAAAEAALANIKANPERHRQRTWHSGDRCCFAGHVALVAGCTWASTSAVEAFVTTPDGRILYCPYAACEVLGIPAGLDHRIFGEYSTLAIIEAEIERVVPETQAPKERVPVTA